MLVAADIIRTVAVAPTLTSVLLLAGIVPIRTFLSFSLELEITGRWQARPGPVLAGPPTPLRHQRCRRLIESRIPRQQRSDSGPRPELVFGGSLSLRLNLRVLVRLDFFFFFLIAR